MLVNLCHGQLVMCNSFLLCVYRIITKLCVKFKTQNTQVSNERGYNRDNENVQISFLLQSCLIHTNMAKLIVYDDTHQSFRFANAFFATHSSQNSLASKLPSFFMKFDAYSEI